MRTIFDLDQGYVGLSPQAKGLYRALSGLPAEHLDLGSVAVIAGCAEGEEAGLAEALVAAGLLESADAPGEGLWVSMDAAAHIHAACVDLGPDPGDGLERWIEYLVGCAAVVDRRVSPAHRLPFPDWRAPQVRILPFGDGAGDGVRWLRGQLPNFLTVIKWASGVGRFDLAYTLAQLLWPLWLWAHPAETREVLELGLAAAGATGSSHALGQMRTTLAGQLRLVPQEVWRAFELDQAARHSAEQDDDPRAVAQALNALGKDCFAAGLPGMAERYFTTAEQMRARLGDERGAGLSRLGRARVVAAGGEQEVALGHLREAHAMLEASGDVFDTLLLAAEIGVTLARSGESAQGLEAIEQSLAGLEAAGAENGVVLVLRMQAEVYACAGRAQEAAQARSRAADLLDGLDPARAARMREGA